MLTVDDLGTALDIGRPTRVVSLVPSLTEAIEVSAPGLLVGVTDWCSHPADLTATRIGGTKWPDLQAITALRPDLVVVNAEENRDEDCAALRSAGIPLWTTAPADVVQALDGLGRLLVALAGSEPTWLSEARAIWADPPTLSPRRRALIPIWRKPWMALGSNTFATDVLRRIGVDNVLADGPERYPKIDRAELAGIDADLVVLPDEPYAFTADDGPESFPGKDIALVSGRHLTWYGPSLAEAPQLLIDQLEAATQL